MMKWIKTSKRLPKPYEPVLIWVPDDDGFVTMASYSPVGVWDEIGIEGLRGWIAKEIDWWQPLPGPP